MSSTPSEFNFSKFEERWRIRAEKETECKELFDKIRMDFYATGDLKECYDLILSYVESLKDSVVTDGSYLPHPGNFSWVYKEPGKSTETDIILTAGQIYEEGLLVSKNIAKAYDCYNMAANRWDGSYSGNAEALYRCGLILEMGEGGVSQDKKASFELYSRAAIQGHFAAQLKLVSLIQCKEWTPPEYFSKFDKITTPLHKMDRWLELAKTLEVGKDENINSIALTLAKLSKLNECFFHSWDSYPNGGGVGIISASASAANNRFCLKWLRTMEIERHIQSARKEDGNALINIGEILDQDYRLRGNLFSFLCYRKAIELDATWNMPPLFWTIGYGPLEQLPYLLEKKPNLNCFAKRQQISREWEGFRDENLSFTPLMFALFKGKYQSARLLLEAGLEVNLATDKGHTAFHHINHIAFLPHLLWYGANPNAKDKMNNTPFDVITTDPTCDYIDGKLVYNISTDLVPASLRTELEDYNLHDMVEHCQVLKPIFDLRYFQLLSNYIETEYLKEYKDDHLLTRNRTRLESLISEVVNGNIESLLSLYQTEIRCAAIDKETSEDEEDHDDALDSVKKKIISAFKECLEKFFLYPRQEELFWKPYIELLLNGDCRKSDGSSLAFKFSTSICKIIINYYLFSYPIIGFSNNPENPFSTQQGIFCEQQLIENRTKWIYAHLQKMHNASVDLKSSVSDSADTKMADETEVVSSKSTPYLQGSASPIVQDRIDQGSLLVYAYNLKPLQKEKENRNGEPPLKKRRTER